MRTFSRRRFLALTGAGIVSFAGLPAARARAGRSPWIASGARFAFRSGGPRVVVIGIGGTGCGILDGALGGSVAGAECVAIDRREGILDRASCGALRPIELRPRRRRGLDSDSRPEHGRRALYDRRDEVARALNDAHLVVLVGGMGGGTATGGAPVVAQIARGVDALVIAVVTRPFAGEGRRRSERAAAGIEALTGICDATFVVPLDRIVEQVGRDVPYMCALAHAADTIAVGVRAVTGVAAVSRAQRVCVGMADLRAMLPRRGIGAIGVAEAAGPARAETAARAALASPLLCAAATAPPRLRDAALRHASGVIVHITAADLTLPEIERVSHIIYDAIADDTLMLLTDDAAPASDGVLRVTLLAMRHLADC